MLPYDFDPCFIGIIAISPEGETVGSAGMSHYTMPPKPIQHDGRFVYVSSMYVLHEHRNRGLAKKMMDVLIKTAAEIGVTWMTLHASEMGRPIYESIGFKAWKEMGLHVPTAVHRVESDS